MDHDGSYGLVPAGPEEGRRSAGVARATPSQAGRAPHAVENVGIFARWYDRRSAGKGVESAPHALRMCPKIPRAADPIDVRESPACTTLPRNRVPATCAQTPLLAEGSVRAQNSPGTKRDRKGSRACKTLHPARLRHAPEGLHLRGLRQRASARAAAGP